jgi:hypothetical protein
MRIITYLLLSLLTILSSFSFIANAANSPIIYGQSGGVPCAYNLIARACVPTSAGGGVDTMAAIGASPNADGASISGTTLTLQPASASFGGLLTTGAQTIAGAKQFSEVNVNGATIAGAKLTVRADNNTNAVAIIDAAGGSGGGMLFGASDSGGAHGFMQGLRADGLANIRLSVQNCAQPLSLGNASQVTTLLSNAITISSYLSCTALTTNGSGVLGCTASDETLKKDIVPFERGLEALAGLTPKTYKFKDPLDKNIEHSGFIAQNVAKSIPEAVRISPQGKMQLDHLTIIAVQANAINELRARLEVLEGTKTKAVKKAIPMKPLYQIKAGQPPNKK